MAVQVGSNLSHRIGKDRHQHGVVAEEIDGLIKAYKDGHVERPQIVPCVTSSLAPELGVTSRDTVIDKFKNIWARFYVPIKFHGKLPLLVYFHGGGFCVGSAAWSCYHDFLARLAAKANCIIMSVNYRLAPENPLPAAYDDGVKALMWASCCAIKPLKLKGIILIQPFFGGEARTHSEKYLVQSPRSALNLAASDTYWRLALPCGANRDHPWCNPLAKGSVKLEGSVKFPIMVCISEMDILKDRNLELVASLGRAGNKRVEHVVCKGVGHAFQILSKSQLRLDWIMARIEGFISGKRSPLSTTVHNLM
uniref:Alpha/beta hydrolase fold-3 domain-containing protein n=1 Tax=Salix viminalis TaxID=40686 RepID=A0A6N2MYF6_SALVM